MYEDDKTLAFLDINPITEGHTLIVPKVEVEFVWDLPDEDYQAVMASAKKVARRLKDVIGKKYVGELIVGTDVPHSHVHVMPFNEPREMKRTLDGPGVAADQDTLAALAQKLFFS